LFHLIFIALQNMGVISAAPCTSMLQMKLKGRQFDTIEEIPAESQKVLDTLTEKDFQEGFQK
jgi:hypothetical protein